MVHSLLRFRIFVRIATASAMLLTAAAIGAELPPEIQVDRLLVQAEREMEDGEHWSAVFTFEQILEVCEEHGLEIPTEFWFRQAGVLHSAGLDERAIEASTRYLQEAGREGKHYRAALDILDEAQVGLTEVRRAEALADQRQAARERERERLATKARIQREQAGDLPRDPMRDGGAGPLMVRIPAGRICSVPRGDDSCWMTDVPPFAISKFAVTVGEFRRFVRDTRYRTTSEGRRNGCYESRNVVLWPGDEGYERSEREFYRRTWKSVSTSQTDRHPVVCVSYADANRYVAWLSDQTGRRYQVPSQMQWQSAFLAGTTIGQLDEPLHPTKYGPAFRDWGHQKPEFWSCLDRGVRIESYRLAEPVGTSCPPSPVGIRFESGLLEWNADEGYGYWPYRQTGATKVDVGFRVVRDP